VERPERLVEAVAILLTRNTAFSYNFLIRDCLTRLFFFIDSKFLLLFCPASRSLTLE
jgi:hypothetical protein